MNEKNCDRIKRRSDKRDAIYAELKKSRSHPSAEMIFAALKPSFGDLSLGTVYRNLAVFKDEGRVITVGVVDGKERYDADMRPHNHFICRACGSVIDVMEPIALNGVFQLESEGNVLESIDIVFHGLCKNCAGVEHK
ncbi:MAG: transcriptional repressor [Oscillospiraceae bacterium]|jgi:Fur family peroxide stress response transcriptional regulator|nr:transcriptional repressor [Oscillospiraceae bacterium]